MVIYIYRKYMMWKKHICNICNYSTDRLYDYKKHTVSQLHTRRTEHHRRILAQNTVNMVKTVTTNEQRNSKESVTCEYCRKKLARKYTLNRHYFSCFNKNKVNEKATSYTKNGKNCHISDLIKLLHEKDEHSATERKLAAKERDKKDVLLAKAYSNIDKMNKKLLEEHLEIKKLLSNAIDNNNTIQYDKMIENNPITAKHVRDNFGDAYHYDKLMAKPLNKKEKKNVGNIWAN
jgi:hypothetical protein